MNSLILRTLILSLGNPILPTRHIYPNSTSSLGMLNWMNEQVMGKLELKLFRIM